MERPRVSMTELAAAAAVATVVCILAFRYDLERAFERHRTARALAADSEYALAVLEGDGWLYAREIDEHGHVLGRARGPDGHWCPMVWSEDRIRLIDLPGCYRGRAVGFADSGTVVCIGYTADAPQTPRSYVCRECGTTVPITPPDTVYLRCSATSANTASEVVGAIGGPGETRAFVWRAGVGTVLIDANPSFAADINDDGQVVGWRIDNEGRKQACIWYPEVDGYRAVAFASASKGWTEACAINEEGMVVGFGGLIDAFSWSEEAGLRLLSELPKQTTARGHDVNARGHIVGLAMTPAGPRATLWRGDQVVDLNDQFTPELGLELLMALAISDDGQILCEAEAAERTLVVVLTPMASS